MPKIYEEKMRNYVLVPKVLFRTRNNQTAEDITSVQESNK